MYLSQGIADFEGGRHPMVGLVPVWTRMTGRLARMGYVEVELVRDGPLGLAGLRMRGHEFHWSEMEGDSGPAAYRVLHPEERLEGYHRGGVLASYVHLHFASNPGRGLLLLLSG